MTLATLNFSGTIPQSNEQLKILCNGEEIRSLIRIRILIGILYGPVDLEGFSLLISSDISSDVTCLIKNYLFEGYP